MAQWLKSGQHITAMGSDSEHKNEIDPAVFERAIYVADSLKQTRRLGELHHAIAAGVAAAEQAFPELGAVIAGTSPGRTSPSDITLADLTGTGVQDTAIATLARDRANAAKAGTIIRKLKTREGSDMRKMTTSNLRFTRQEYSERLAKTRRAMEAKGIDLLIVSDPSNMHWLTGYDGWSFYVHQAVIVPPDGEPVWYGRGQDANGARRTSYLSDDNIVPYADHYVQSTERHPMDYLAQILASGAGTSSRSASRWTITGSPPRPFCHCKSICRTRASSTRRRW